MSFDPLEPRDKQGRWSKTAAKLAKLMKEQGGFTHIVGTGETNPAKGFSVGITGADGKDGMTLPHGATTEKDIRAFAKKYQAELSKPGRAIGGWSNDDPSLGGVRDALDVVEVHTDREQAMEAARRANQDAIFDLETFDTIPTEKAPVKKKKAADLAYQTPLLAGDFELSSTGGKLAFWKQILPKRAIEYTAKDGSRQRINFDDKYLTDLATSQAVDTVPFLLADKDNAHTMDPERQRGDVQKFEVRDDGLYAKIVFPDVKSAEAVIRNPQLGVSARIREGIHKSDGSTLSRGIIHVLGTLDPQVGGMSPWQPTDLSTEQGEVLDLTSEEYKDMAKKNTGPARDINELTAADIEAFSDEELDEFLAQVVPEFSAVESDEDEDDSDELEDEDEDEEESLLAGAGASLSNKARADIELANQRADAAGRKAQEALKRLAEAQWTATKDAYLNAGVPPFALDLAAPVLNRPDDMVIDLSVTDDPDVNVTEVVKGLLDALKGTVDLSNEQGHNGSWDGNGEDPDKPILDSWVF